MILVTRTAVCLGLVLFSAAKLQAEVDFYRDVFPILKTNCLACHNKTTTEASLNLESPELLRTGGDTGAGAVPGKSLESLVYLASVQTGDVVMPPEGNSVGAKKLTPEELKLLATWINEGAKDSVRQAEKIVWRALPTGVHPIYAVDTTRDGRWAASGRGNQVAVYDLVTRQFSGILKDPSLPIDQAKPNQVRTHESLVQSLAFSPDGKKLASGGYREVKIWRQAEQEISPLPDFAVPGLVTQALSQDGKLRVCLDDKGNLQVSDVSSGKVTKTISGIGTGALKLSISADGGLAAVATPEQKVTVWNLSSGEKIATISAPTPVNAITWTTDGKSVAVAGDDKLVRLWAIPQTATTELPEPKQLAGATAALNVLHSVNHPDRLVGATADGTLFFWNLSDGAMVKSFQIAGALTYAVSPDGKLIAAGCADGTVRVWDIQAGKSVIDLKGDRESQNRLADVNWQLATQTLERDYQTKEIARLNAANKSLDEVIKKANETVTTVNKVLPDKKKAHTDSVAASAAAQAVADAISAKIAMLMEGMSDAELKKQLEAEQPKLTKARETASEAQKALQISENHLNDATNEITIATAAQKRNTQLLEEATQANTASATALEQAKAKLAEVQKALAEQKKRPVAVAFSANSQVIATVFNNGEQRLWGLASGTPMLYEPGRQEIANAAIASTGAGQFVTSLADGKSTTLNFGGNWMLERILGGNDQPLEFADRINALRFSPDGKTLAIGGGEPSRSGEISLWDVESGNKIAHWPDRHTDAVLCLDFSPDGKLIASGASDKLVKVTAIASGEVVRLFEGHTHHALGVGFRADGRILASSGSDGAVLIWDMQIGERIRKITGWNKEVTASSFLGGTINIATTGGDQMIRVVNDQGAEVRAIRNLPDFIHSLAAPADGSLIVAGGEDGVLRVWNAADGKELIAFPPAK